MSKKIQPILLNIIARSGDQFSKTVCSVLGRISSEEKITRSSFGSSEKYDYAIEFLEGSNFIKKNKSGEYELTKDIFSEVEFTQEQVKELLKYEDLACEILRFKDHCGSKLDFINNPY